MLVREFREQANIFEQKIRKEVADCKNAADNRTKLASGVVV